VRKCIEKITGKYKRNASPFVKEADYVFLKKERRQVLNTFPDFAIPYFLFLLLHAGDFPFERHFQFLHCFIEIMGCRNSERVVALFVMVIHGILDLPVFSFFWLDDQLCHEYKEYINGYLFFLPDC